MDADARGIFICDYSVFNNNVYAGGVLLFDNFMTAVILNGHIWLIHVHIK